MSSLEKTDALSSDFEVSSQEQQPRQPDGKASRIISSTQLAVCSLSLLCGLVVLATASNVASVYNSTLSFDELHLPLWPENLDVRPTNALVAAGVLITMMNVVALAFAKMKKLQTNQLVNRLVTLGAASISFLSAFVAVVLFYSVNASTTVDTVQSWSCQWDIADMSTRPYFGSVCKQSQTALFLSIILIPVELAALGLALYRTLSERKAMHGEASNKSSSPSLA